MPQRGNANLVIRVPRTGRGARAGGVLLAALALVLIAWKLLPDGRLEVDAGRGLLLKDGRKLARIAEIECVRITEPPSAEEEARLMTVRAWRRALARPRVVSRSSSVAR